MEASGGKVAMRGKKKAQVTEKSQAVLVAEIFEFNSRNHDNY